MKFIGVDTETHLISSHGTSRVNTGRPVPDLVCTTFSGSADFEGLIMWDEEAEVHGLLFDDNECTFVFHNVEFDLAVLVRAYPELKPRLKELVNAGRIWDTRVMYRMRDPDPISKVFSLKHLVEQELGLSVDKGDVRVSFRRGMELTRDQRTYAIRDAVLTRQLAEALWAKPYGSITHGEDASRYQKHVACALNENYEIPDVTYSKAAANMAWCLGGHGLLVDRERLREVHGALETKVEEQLRKLRIHGLSHAKHVPGAEVERIDGYDVNAGRAWSYCATLKSMVRRSGNAKDGYRLEKTEASYHIRKQLLRGHFEEWAEEHGIVSPRTEKTNEVSMARDDWKDYYTELTPALRAYLDYEKAKVFLSRYTTPLLESGAREIHPTYWIPGAATMRWAATKPPVQQWPPVAKPCIVARPGKSFVYADYPSLELYTLAHSMKMMGITGDMMEALESGVDVHEWAAARMVGKEVADVTKSERQAAKACNYGLPGGMGAKTFMKTARAASLDWDLDDAKDMKNLWFAAFPDVREFLSQLDLDPWDWRTGTKAEWLQSLGFTSSWPSNYELTKSLNRGRLYTVTIPTGVVIPERHYTNAANSFFQAPGGVVITTAFNLCAEGSLPVCGVTHDSIMLESRLPEPEGRLLTEIMADALQTVCPSVPRVTIEFEVFDRWK